MKGAEIGALDKPLVRKQDSTVLHVDHCDTASLKARWRGQRGVDASRLHVDAVWGAHTLGQALQAAGAFDGVQGLDYIVASHVVEHVPDLVAWLQEIGACLATGGRLRLAVPDKRYSFDYLRSTSSLADVLDAHARHRRTPSGARVLDFALHAATVDCAAAWRGLVVEADLEHWYSAESAQQLAHSAETTDHYHDVHCWVFTPESFVALMLGLAEQGLLPLACEWVTSTRRNTVEFFVSMSMQTDSAKVLASWRAASNSPPAAQPMTTTDRIKDRCLSGMLMLKGWKQRARPVAHG